MTTPTRGEKLWVLEDDGTMSPVTFLRRTVFPYLLLSDHATTELRVEHPSRCVNVEGEQQR